MAKQSYRIEDFSGGLNRDSDPKDILDNESGILWNWNVDEGGVLKLGGGQALPTYGPTINDDMPGNSSILNESITQDMAGFNLGTFASDFNLESEFIKTEFYLLGNESGFVDVLSFNSEQNDTDSNVDNINISNNFIDFNGSLGGIRDNNPKVKFYHADGGIRIYDTNLNNNSNKNQSLIHVNRKFMTKARADTTLLESGIVSDINWNEQQNVSTWINDDAQFDTESPFIIGSKNFDNGSSDGDLKITSHSMGLAFGTFNGSLDFTERFPINVEDNNNEVPDEGKGYAIRNGGSGLAHKVLFEFRDNADNQSGTDFPSALRKKWSYWITFKYDINNTTVLSPMLDSDGDIYISDFEDTSVVANDEYPEFRFAIAFNPNGGVRVKTTNNFGNKDLCNIEGFNLIDIIWNPRIIGFNIYMQESKDNFSPLDNLESESYLLVEADLVQGMYRTPCSSDSEFKRFKGQFDSIDENDDTILPLHTKYFTIPIQITQLSSETFLSEFGYFGKKKQYRRYKTATILNRRTYIANVATLLGTKQSEELVLNGSLDNYDKTIEQTFDDRMVKSPVNAFDTFPLDNFVDVSINDGDEIIHLEGFSDRILQYKEKILYIINVSQDFEFLESQHPHLGIKNHHQVCKTPYGIAWINDKGVHFYDGRGIKNLIDNKISPGSVISNKHSKIINSSYNQALFDDEGVLTDSDGNNVFHKYLGWAAFMNSDFENVQNLSGNFERNSLPSIGYDATSDKLIILRNLGSQGANQSTTWVYAYNFKKNAWTCHPFAYHNNIFEQNKTNFINNKKGELILYSSRESIDTNTTNNTNDRNTQSNTALDSNSVGFYKWSDRREDKINSKFLQGINSLSSPVQDLIWYRSKVISFGSEGKKNVFSVHVTYRCSSDTDIRASFLTNGDKDLIESINKNYRTENFFNFGNSQEVNSDGIPLYQGRKFKSTGGKWQKVVLKPHISRQAKGIYTFQFQLHNTNPEIRQPDDFAINDITIIYRNKGFHYQKQQS